MSYSKQVVRRLEITNAKQRGMLLDVYLLLRKMNNAKLETKQMRNELREYLISIGMLNERGVLRHGTDSKR